MWLIHSEVIVNADSLLFWILTIVTLVSGFAVITLTNPIYSALSLAMTMVGVAGLFVTLDAYFIAGVQLIVYAGAVMVLFVMVLMLFDLKNELTAFSKGKIVGALKLATVGMLAGLIIGAISLTKTAYNEATAEATKNVAQVDATKAVGQILFTDYVFGFEALGVLLLIIAVGVVALSRSKGGTHAQH